MLRSHKVSPPETSGSDSEDAELSFSLQWDLCWSESKAKVLKCLKEFREKLCKLLQLANKLKLSHFFSSSDSCASDLCEFEIDVIGDNFLNNLNRSSSTSKETLNPSATPMILKDSTAEKTALSNIFSSGRYGDCIRVRIEGVLAPTYYCTKSPTMNWGFLFTSCWAVYSSFPLPLRGQCEEMEDFIDGIDRTELKIFDREINRYNHQMSLRGNLM
jgi:hypothetical protein